MFLRSAIKEHDIPVRDQDSFTTLIDAIDKGATSEQMKVPIKAKVLELNKARVAFKHYGLAPELAASRRLVAYASDFFAEACPRFFGFDFDALSLADEVQNDVIRNALKRAEQAIEQGEFKEVQCAAAEAVHWASNSWDQVLTKPAPHFSDVARLVPDSNARNAVDRTLRYVSAYLDGLRTVSLCNLFRLDPKDFVRFRNLSPMVLQYGGGRLEYHFSPSANTSEEGAKFCFDFALRFALSAQGQ
ncbi:hypothetical protein M0D68_03360 [Paraburkholderia sp. SEWSISQ10-3 4]|uniref:hypothetical protein n=1 Tax=Paraburkholderia TaxID=1822464 RepID=UPI0022589416|nr:MULTISPECIES: hypothetical protein [Paraburkholderia]MCX4137203.1 hypothetical protein [Paraburkholderia aspalathi]MDN7169895.1 hypothetical protein [Paraburkholderia sp. SEWSISQ10-3 4]MDQ6499534.1 hypothetical protein [Paraburkholderia aspalathi]